MRLKQLARPVAFLLLIAFTVYGVWEFFSSGDPETGTGWRDVLDYWRGRLGLLPLIILMACLDVALEGVGWLWIYARMGLRSWGRGAVLSFLAGRAGLFLPAQLGRLIRPDSMARLGRGTMGQCLKAEAVTFVLDSTSVLALIVALAAAKVIHPIAAPFAALAIIVAVLFLGNRISRAIAHTRVALPVEFWWSWQTFAIIVVEMTGWAAHGIAFYVMIRGLGDVTWWDTIFFTSASSIVGAGTGLPGGIGATEGLLGMSLTLMDVPKEHLGLAVGAFRVFTFWMWIPIGYVALLAIRRRAARNAALRAEAEASDAAGAAPETSPE